MEEYNHHHQLSESSNSKGTNNFLYGSSQVLAPSYARNSTGAGFPLTNFHLNQSNDCYDRSNGQQHPTVKTEGGAGSRNHENYSHTRFQYNSAIRSAINIQESDDQSCVGGDQADDDIKAKIIAHPHYSNLLEAYMDCQKVGAPPEVVAKLTSVRRELEARQRAAVGSTDVSKDPELDQFMEAYYDMLVKYREELTRPLQEAMEFMRRIETQLNMLTATGSSVRAFNSEEKCDGIGSSEEDQENSGGETDQLLEIDPRAEDRELKNHLLRKYSGYLSSLQQELSKKKKKGKLPKDGRQKLLNWWELHYKWPYPSESEKVALAESTGLDQKQINNWFINQRKRHWKPSEDMQFMVMDGLHPQNGAIFMDGHYMGEGPYRLGP